VNRELDLQALRLIVHLEDLGSLGQAGRELGITQPAASACLRGFETRWQITVAQRSARGTRLTPDGATVAVWARDLLHSVDTIRGGLRALGAAQHSDGVELTVAASLTIAEFLLPRWLGELRAARPEAHPQLQVVNSDAAAELVRNGSCDLGFVESPRIATDLARQVVGADRLVVVVRSAHPWARRTTPLDRRQLLAAEYVVREVGSGTRETFERALAAQPRIAMVTTSTTSLVGAVRAGFGPAVVTSHAVRAGVETGELVVVPHTLHLDRPLTAIWRRDRTLPGAALDLLRIVRRAGQPAH